MIQAGNLTVASLEGLFGRPMDVEHIYKARLQFLVENPYLCDDFNPNRTTFVQPLGPQVPTTDGNFTLADPIALIAARGECPFQRKAHVAEQMGMAVEFLIVYNFNVDGEDALVPLYSEYGGSTRLMLLSVTHRAGHALKECIAADMLDTLPKGGPIVYLDATPPDGILTIEDLQNMMLSALGLFFMLISASSCLMICAGSHGYVITNDGRVILVAQQAGGPSTGSSSSGGGGRSSLLTEAQVRQLSQASRQQQQSDEEAAAVTVTDAEEVSCAVCIDEISDNQDLIVLPCHHKFHTDCIIPWLTERQAHCPLCKYDVMEYYRELEASNPVQQQQQESQSVLRAFSNRILRQRWTRVDINEHRDGVVLAPNEMEVDNDVELTEQRLT